MYKQIMALEENAELISEIDKNTINDVIEDNIDIENQMSNIEQTNDLVEQGLEVKQTLEKIDNASTPEEKLDIAVEALLNSIGGSKQNFSLESFNNKFNRNINLAEESILSSTKELIFKVSTSDKKLNSLINNALNDLKNSNSDKEYVEFGFSKNLLFKDNISIYSSKELNELNSLYSKIFDSPSAKKFLEVNNKFLKAVINNSKNIKKEIETYYTEIVKLHKQILSDKKIKTGFNTDVKFKPLKYSEAKKAVNDIQNIKDKNSSLLKEYINSLSLIKDKDPHKIATEDFAKDWAKELLKTLSSVGWWFCIIFLFPFAVLWLAIVPLLRTIVKDEEENKNSNNYSEESFKEEELTIKAKLFEAYTKSKEIVKFYKDIESDIKKSEMALYHYIKESK